METGQEDAELKKKKKKALDTDEFIRQAQEVEE